MKHSKRIEMNNNDEMRSRTLKHMALTVQYQDHCVDLTEYIFNVAAGNLAAFQCVF